MQNQMQITQICLPIHGNWRHFKSLVMCTLLTFVQ